MCCGETGLLWSVSDNRESGGRMWHENVCRTVRVMPGVRSRCIRGSRIDDWAVAGATV